MEHIQIGGVDIQRQQIELMKRMSLPAPKPPVFSGNILEFPKWVSAFDALIEEEAVKPGHKLYYLGEYTSGSAQKMINSCWVFKPKMPTSELERYFKIVLVTHIRFTVLTVFIVS
jgi:hypothetical protein